MSESSRPHVAALPLDVSSDPSVNRERVLGALDDAARDGVDLLVLPEMWPTSFTPDAGPEVLSVSREIVEEVAERAATLGLLVAGTAYGPPAGSAPGAQPGLPTNRLHLFDGGRDLLAYDKVHLFTPTAEHLTFAAGTRPCPVADTRIGRISGLICYDLRFPELVREALRDRVDILLCPAQWPRPRDLHWTRLARARAIDGLCYVVGANRGGKAVIGRRRMELEFPGNACIVSPHGELLAEGDGGEERVAATLDLEEVRELRKRLPLVRDERPDLYREWLAPRGSER